MARLVDLRGPRGVARGAWIWMMVGLALLLPHRAWCDLTRYLAPGSSWRFFPGLQEPALDLVSWRDATFDDGAWLAGLAPLGYGLTTQVATDLNRLTPPMRANYSVLYLRASFELTDPTGVIELHANVDYDDGFILWINGIEVARANAPEGAAPPFTGVATRSHAPGAVELFDELPNPQTFLLAGRNWVAVQAFNLSKTNNDFKFDLELFDPLGPDLSPPSVVDTVPPPGVAVKSLSRVEITFSEEVRGVDAQDLLVGGEPATGLARSGAGPFVFSFPALDDGEARFEWAAQHGITDLSPRANALGGAAWSNTVDSQAPEADLVLGEISATGGNEAVDADGDPSDWIEIFNRGITQVQMLGWSLTDDPGDPGQWIFPELTLGPGERLLVFASGKDRRDPASELHANFSLAVDGEYIGLYRPESPRGVVTEIAPRYPEQRAGFSYGLAGAGADLRFAYLSPPTPGNPNASAVSPNGFVAEPVFSVERGFHDAPFQLTLASRTAGAVLRYTLDGSEPTSETGELYAGPVTIQGTPQRAVVTVRAMAFKDGHLPSRPVTSTHVFAAHVLTQPRTPAGFPTTWGTQAADYAMDASVIAQAGDRAMAGLLALPHISIVTPVDNLFSRQKGIYANASLSGPAWERPVSVEALYPDGRRGFQVDCGLRTQGGSSTGDWKSIKLSMRLLFRGDYGASKLEERLFDDSAVNRFDSVVLDAHLNLTYTHPDHAQRVRSQFVRDLYVCDLQRATGSLGPHGRFVHLYLNGLYWGMYDLHERADAAFAAEHLGGDKSEYDIVRHNGTTLVDGNLQAWNETFRRARLNLQSPENYLALAEYLDLDDLADYMLVNIYAGNTDWAHHNWYAGRRRLPGEKLRFFSWDAEHVLKSTTESVLAVNNAGAPTELFTRLRASPEFRLLFADHVERHFAPGGPFHVDRTSPAWDETRPELNRPASLYMQRIAEIDTAVILESARWGDARRPGQPYTRDNEFQAELDLLHRTYFPQRSQIVLNQLTAIGLYPKLAAPVLSHRGGDVQPGIEIELSLPELTVGRILVTTDGSDPRAAFSGEVSPTAIEYAQPIVLRDSTRLQARTLNDTTWSVLSAATFTVVRPRDALRLTEIHYHPAAEPGSLTGAESPEFLELTNVSSLTVNLAGLFFAQGIEHVFAPGARLSPGERLVLTSSLAHFQARFPGVGVHGEFRGSLDNGGETLALVDAAGDEVLTVRYDDEADWPQGPDGYGWSLVLVDLALDPNDPTSWRASGQVGGSPGAADVAVAPWGVVINEVLAHSSLPYEDAIEVANTTQRAIDISNWYLSDDRDGAQGLMKFRLPAGAVVPAQGFLVFYESEFNAGVESPGAFGLAADGDDVYLASANAAGELTGHITGYSFDATPDGVTVGRLEISQGTAFTALARPTLGVESPATVAEFRTGKGAPNAGPRMSPVVFNEIHYHPATGLEYLELYNSGLVAVELGAAAGAWRIAGILDQAGIGDFELPPGTTLAPRGYLLITPVEPAVFRELLGLAPNVALVGPYRGGLDNGGERLRLLRPFGAGDHLVHHSVDDVRYRTRAPWASEPDGAGPALERIQATAFADDAANWAASDADGGTPGAVNSRARAGDKLEPYAELTVSPGATSTLEVVLDASPSLDPDGEITLVEWSLGDGATASGRTVTHTFAAAGRYLVRLRVTDDSGLVAESVRTIGVPAIGRGGAQLPGDANQDARVDLSDAIALLRRLFFGATRTAPCGGESLSAGGNLTLLDLDASATLDLTDAIFLLNYLYRGGPPPVPGVECVLIPGCPDVCGG